MESKYTSVYSEAVESLLDGVLENLASDIGHSQIAKFLEFVVLGGGYGRGEGGVLDGLPYNDLDFFVVAKDGAGRAARARIDFFFAKQSEEIREKAKVDADFSKAVPLSYARKRMDLMAWREMAMSGILVFGDEKKFEKSFEIKSETTDVRSSEILKLAMNRLSGLVFALEKILRGNFSRKNRDFIARNTNKALLACGDIYIAASAKLPFRIADRLEAALRLPMPAEAKAAYKKAAKFKASPKISEDTEKLKSDFEAAFGLLKISFEDTLKFLLRPDGILRRIKNILLSRRLRPLFQRAGARNQIFADPKKEAANLAIKILQSPKMQTRSNFSAYKKIWKILS